MHRTTYHSTNSDLNTDRIERAIKLIEAGAVTPWGKGVWLVRTERMFQPYTVTVDGCDCPDFEYRLKGQSPCKHMWAAIGATAAVLIHEIRQAETLTELAAIGHAHSDAMQALPDAFVRVARAEYRRRFDALTRAEELRRQAEKNAMLIKPQPRSNGRINGIEI